MASRFPAVGVIVAGLTLLGCQAAPPPEVLVPVSGKVTIKGKPLGMGTIVFHPDRDKGNTSKLEPRGTISDDGSYQLESRDSPGAPAGAYKVTIYAMKNAGSTKPSTWIASQKFTDVKTSGLTAEVTADSANQSFDFAVTPP